MMAYALFAHYGQLNRKCGPLDIKTTNTSRFVIYDTYSTPRFQISDCLLPANATLEQCYQALYPENVMIPEALQINPELKNDMKTVVDSESGGCASRGASKREATTAAHPAKKMSPYSCLFGRK